MSGNDRPNHQLPYWEGQSRRAIQMNIGQELKMHYELPPELPMRIRALILELDERSKQKTTLGTAAVPVSRIAVNRKRHLKVRRIQKLAM